MRLEHHLVGGYVRYISPHIIISQTWFFSNHEPLQFSLSYLMQIGKIMNIVSPNLNPP